MKKTKLIPFVLCAFSVVGMTGCGKENKNDPVEPSHTHSYELKHDETHHWQECSCGDKKDITTHNWEETGREPATCQHGEITTYECPICEQFKQEEGATKAEHHYHLDYIVPASCVEDGKYVYVCDNCPSTKEMIYSDSEAHNYGRAEFKGNLITYYCTNEGCEEHYSVLSAVDKEVAEVSMSELSEVGAIELKEATIALDDDTLLGLGKEVTIGAEKLSEEELSKKVVLDDETKELLKDSPVFDFSMKSGDEEIHEFLGKVTVSIPYEIQPGEDPNGISIAYISDSGEVENIPAVYRNGMVSFETTHFSVYALVKMTAEEACAKFGHAYSLLYTEKSTCAKHGSEVHICTRCGYSMSKELPLVDHSYVLNGVVESSKYEHGYIEYKCSECGDTFREELPLLPETDNGYVMNLISSLLSQNLKFSVKIEEELSTNVDVAAVLALAEEKQFVATYEEGEMISFIDEEKTYSFGHNSDTSDFAIVTVIAQLVKSSPQSVVKLIEIVTDVLSNTLVSKNVTTSGATITFDKAKVKALIEAFKTEDVFDFVDTLFGAGFYDKIYDLVANFSTRTIQESLDALEGSFGINSNEIYDFVVEILPIFMSSPASPAEEMPVHDVPKEGQKSSSESSSESALPSYDDIFNEDMLASKGTVLLSMLPEEIASFIGSKESLDSFLKSFKDVTVVDLVSSFAGTNVSALLESYADEIDSVLDLIKFEINTTSSGQVLNGFFTISGLEVFGAPAGAKITASIEPIANMQDLKADCEAFKVECKKVEEAFDFTKQDVIDKTLGRMYNGLHFTYFEDYKDRGPAFVSEETNMFNTYMEYSDETLTKLIICAPTNQYISKYDDVHNMFDGHKICVGEFNFYSCYLEICDEDYTDLVHVYFGNLFPAYRWLDWYYDLETGEYTPHSDDFGGEHLYKYEAVSKAEYEAHAGTASIYNNTFWKRTCLVCGYVDYIQGYNSSSVSGPFTSSLMDAEARKYNFYIECYNGNTSPVEIRVQKVDEIDYTKSNMTVYLNELCDEENMTFNFGNVTISYEFKERPGYSCSIVNTVTILIDGKVFTKIVKNMHYYSSHTEEVRTYVSECCDHVDCYRYCDICGELIEHWSYESEHHNYHTTTIVNGNEYVGSIVQNTCSVCGKSYTSYGERVRHTLEYNNETGKYYCEDCGEEMELVEHYHFAELSSALPAGFEVLFLPEDCGCAIAVNEFISDYSDYGWYTTYSLYNLLSDNQVGIAVANVSSDEIEFADNGYIALDPSKTCYVNAIYLDSGIGFEVIVLSNSEVEQLRTALAENPEMSLFITITDTSGSGNTFFVPFSF